MVVLLISDQKIIKLELNVPGIALVYNMAKAPLLTR